jgi:hypothetical protein
MSIPPRKARTGCRWFWSSGTSDLGRVLMHVAFMIRVQVNDKSVVSWRSAVGPLWTYAGLPDIGGHFSEPDGRSLADLADLADGLLHVADLAIYSTHRSLGGISPTLPLF